MVSGILSCGTDVCAFFAIKSVNVDTCTTGTVNDCVA